ncbi:hypothetical protein ACJJTC_010761 [Scirpophaga incertulas]
MPLRRTPDKQMESDSDANVTFRKKSRPSNIGNTIDNELLTQISELKQMFLEFKTNQEQKFEKIYSSFDEIKKQNRDLCNSIDFLSTSCDSLKEQIHKLDTECQSNYQYIKSLEDRLDKIEASSRSTSK